MSRTWWGERFLEAMSEFADPGRLQRGRSYSGDSRILMFDISDGEITATVRGNVNPYFGVYKEPKYIVNVALTAIPMEDWPDVIRHLSSKAGSVAKLLLNEMPDEIEESFDSVGQSLLPGGFDDFQSSCSCPDWSRPCKHIAGVCYRLAQHLDRDPFLLFELRGLSREELQAELVKSPLGRALSAELSAQSELQPQPVAFLFARPEPIELDTQLSPREFWQGTKRLPQTVESIDGAAVPAIVVKKQGDYPPFWHKDKSFIEVMEELYGRVKVKNKDLL
ncbi:SWIM zinc finger family protein [Synechococcus sp. PCC 7336]|uniref:SWIM zinc finger family protein n=1 Tax=Synechococcus sp. PCC 7336 TaxID=195250 RepID=UPI00035C900E|nr:SWIM zinc finger family protein [Synechococcus sp. PCC 7336]